MLRWIACFWPMAVIGCGKGETGDHAPIAVPLGPKSAIREGFTSFPVARLGVFREGDKFKAVSMVCTHQTCLLNKTASEFECPCHGSIFSPEGAVLKGPAEKPLRWFKLSVESGNLIAHLGEVTGPHWIEL